MSNKHTLPVATNELSRYLVRLKLSLKDTDPAVTGEALLWVAAIEGVVNYMKESVHDK